MNFYSLPDGTNHSVAYQHTSIYQPTSGLTSSCPHTKVNDHLVCLGVFCSQNFESPSRCWLSRTGLSYKINLSRLRDKHSYLIQFWLGSLHPILLDLIILNILYVQCMKFLCVDSSPLPILIPFSFKYSPNDPIFIYP